jgi:serine/threonine protein kinase
MQGQAESEFLSELGTLGRVRHRNLVALKGFCVSSEDCFLILDYAAGGNLDQALRNRKSPGLGPNLLSSRVNACILLSTWPSVTGLAFILVLDRLFSAGVQGP